MSSAVPNRGPTVQPGLPPLKMSNNEASSSATVNGEKRFFSHLPTDSLPRILGEKAEKNADSRLLRLASLVGAAVVSVFWAIGRFFMTGWTVLTACLKACVSDPVQADLKAAGAYLLFAPKALSMICCGPKPKAKPPTAEPRPSDTSAGRVNTGGGVPTAYPRSFGPQAGSGGSAVPVGFTQPSNQPRRPVPPATKQTQPSPPYGNTTLRPMPQSAQGGPPPHLNTSGSAVPVSFTQPSNQPQRPVPPATKQTQPPTSHGNTNSRPVPQSGQLQPTLRPTHTHQLDSDRLNMSPSLPLQQPFSPEEGITPSSTGTTHQAKTKRRPQGAGMPIDKETAAGLSTDTHSNIGTNEVASSSSSPTELAAQPPSAFVPPSNSRSSSPSGSLDGIIPTGIQSPFSGDLQQATDALEQAATRVEKIIGESENTDDIFTSAVQDIKNSVNVLRQATRTRSSASVTTTTTTVTAEATLTAEHRNE